ncbi:hypothetical protein [Nitrobacter sp. TKz-YC01]|uniref:hypothetical protein n=1 Tax=Nitrobacter sp. TKz-YC01 TaxID=3398703 RepID=UPI003A0FEDB7
MDTRELFKVLGFEEEWETTAHCPAYVYDFGNLRLSAIECIGRFYRSVFLLTGVNSGARSIGMIHFEMPLKVDSFEQGVALIAHAVGRDFMPACRTTWLSEGREWQEFLPWERARQFQEQLYAARPKCWVARDWFRVARPRLYTLAKEAAENDLVGLTFDGEILRFTAPRADVIVPAAGEAWPDSYAIKAVELDAVPKRVLADPVQVTVWEHRLAIDRHTWSLVGQPGLHLSGALELPLGDDTADTHDLTGRTT